MLTRETISKTIRGAVLVLMLGLAVLLLVRSISISAMLLTGDALPSVPVNAETAAGEHETPAEPAVPMLSAQERVALAQERSHNVKGVYMTSLVASSERGAGRTKRDNIVTLINDTELNAVVIDVKEVNGSELNQNLADFVANLKRQGIWTIARVALMRDSSQTAEHPDWYLQHAGGYPWRDALGHAWLDPAHQDVANYLIDFSQEVIDAGFDEIQADYIRYPSDGNLRSIAPSSLPENKFTVIDLFAEKFVRDLKAHKPEVVVSADLFGYIATLKRDNTIGQRLEDLGQHFDYISLMLYPNHFYAGFSVPADIERDLPAVSLGYGVERSRDVVAHPYTVLHRSILAANDTIATTTGKARMRPFLQDFNLSYDVNRGIVYGPDMVRAQIDGAQDAGASGWLLWNSGNNYTRGALHNEDGAPNQEDEHAANFSE